LPPPSSHPLSLHDALPIFCDRYGPGFGVPAVFPFTSFEVVTDWVSVFVGALIPPGVIIMCRVSCATGAFAGFCWHNLQCKVVTVLVHTVYDGLTDGGVRVPVTQCVWIGAQFFHPRNDNEQHDEGEWYRRDNDQRLQAFQGCLVSEDQHDEGNTAHDQSPEDHDQFRRVLTA